jgi:gliding motility-associated-like protein
LGDAYYFIDNVSVIACDDSVINHTSSLRIPNIFTPNNDQYNDVFQVAATNIADLNCVIYNRWGVKVWQIKGPAEAWDGHDLTGTACTPGVYYYVLSATGLDGKVFNENGFLELLR